MDVKRSVRALLTGAVLRDLLARSRWYRVGFAAALLGAALDGWLSPAVITNHPGTGELNALSAFHVLDGLTFASVRVLAVVAAACLVALAVSRDGLSAWSHAAMGLLALVNYANGTLALSSGLAAAGTAELEVGHFTGGSLLAAGLTLAAACWLVRGPRPTNASRWTGGRRRRSHWGDSLERGSRWSDSRASSDRWGGSGRTGVQSEQRGD